MGSIYPICCDVRSREQRADGAAWWAQVFGEPKGQPSRALPNGAMDSTMGQLAGVGMGAAAVLLFAHLLKGASL